MNATMKLIENSLDSENLQSLVSFSELKVKMASCDVQVNGQETNKDNISEKESLKIKKMTNGINGNNSTPVKENGVNDYFNYEISEEDYQLVLESSSDEGGSPSKKVDDNMISAPQIVQEIEDLLGIDSRSAKIEEELKISEPENADNKEKEDINETDSIIASNIPQEIQDVFKEKEDIPNNKEENLSKVEKCKQDTKDENADSNSLSIMSVVFDEVEIGTDNIDISNDNLNNDATLEGEKKVVGGVQEDKITSIITPNELDISSNEINESQVNESGKLGSFDKDVLVQKLEKKNNEVDNQAASLENDIPLTQSSNTSDSSAEWTVIDSVEESEDELNQRMSTDCGRKELSSMEEKNNIDCNNKEFRSMEEKNNIDYDNKESGSMEKENKEHSCITTAEKNVVELSMQYEEDEPRKRTASLNEEEIAHKKPKLETEETLQRLKRSCSESEQETKRTKLCDSLSEPVHQTTDQHEDLEKNTLLKDGIDIKSNIGVDLKNCVTNKKINYCVDEENYLKKSYLPENNISTSVNTEIKPSNSDKQLTINEVDSLKVVSSMESVACENDSSQVIFDTVSDCSGKTDVTITKDESSSDKNICKPAYSKPEIDSSFLNEGDQLNNDCSNVQNISEIDPEIQVRRGASSTDGEVKSPNEGILVETNISNDNSNSMNKSNSFETDEHIKQLDKLQSDNNVSNMTTDKNEQSQTMSTPSNETAETIKNTNVIKQNSQENVVPLNNKVKDTNNSILVEGKLSESVGTNKVNLKESSLQIEKINQCSVNTKQTHNEIDNKHEEKLKTIPTVIESSITKEVPVMAKEEHIGSVQNSSKHNIDTTLNITDSDIWKKSVKTKEVQAKNGPFDLLNKHFQNNKPETKQNLSTIDKAIENVVDKARSDTDRRLPLLKRFHIDQLKKMTRLDLEEVIVMKICEAITDRSDLGQMRLRCQSLEQNCELWRKKAMQLEKQNRELEMVLKRYLSETAQIKKENHNKLALPIRVTRSVGLQVVLESTMHGALVASKSKVNCEKSDSERKRQSNKQQVAQQQLQQLQSTKKKQMDKDTNKESVKAPVFNPPAQTGRGRGRPAKSMNPNRATSSVTSTSQPLPSKVTPPSTPIKPQTQNRQVGTPSKDLEVIDLTDRDEKSKSLSQSPPGGSIRISPSTQVCFMQNTSSPSTTQTPMAYLVQKPGQRQQYLVTTSSPSPPRSLASHQRPPPALALPVFRSGGQIIPVQSTSQGGVRTTPSTSLNTSRQVPPGIRLSSPPILKHPAPLPPPPAMPSGPGMKVAPPKPQLKIAKTVNGIMLSWSMSLTKELAEMASYQLYAYQEGSQQPSSSLWKKVGDVKALPLPMACTLTQFMEGNKYHFAVRAVDVHGRVGPFSSPGSILLTK